MFLLVENLAGNISIKYLWSKSWSPRISGKNPKNVSNSMAFWHKSKIGHRMFVHWIFNSYEDSHCQILFSFLLGREGSPVVSGSQ